MAIFVPITTFSPNKKAFTSYLAYLSLNTGVRKRKKIHLETNTKCIYCSYSPTPVPMQWCQNGYCILFGFPIVLALGESLASLGAMTNVLWCVCVCTCVNAVLSWLLYSHDKHFFPLSWSPLVSSPFSPLFSSSLCWGGKALQHTFRRWLVSAVFSAIVKSWGGGLPAAIGCSRVVEPNQVLTPFPHPTPHSVWTHGLMWSTW